MPPGLYLVGDEHGGLVPEEPLDAAVKDVLGGVVVDGRQGVVEEDEVTAEVGAPVCKEGAAGAVGEFSGRWRRGGW
jgi:hypothetical protein